MAGAKKRERLLIYSCGVVFLQQQREAMCSSSAASTLSEVGRNGFDFIYCSTTRMLRRNVICVEVA